MTSGSETTGIILTPCQTYSVRLQPNVALRSPRICGYRLFHAQVEVSSGSSRIGYIQTQ